MRSTVVVITTMQFTKIDLTILISFNVNFQQIAFGFAGSERYKREEK